MLKLKLELDATNADQMEALALFANRLAGAQTVKTFVPAPGALAAALKEAEPKETVTAELPPLPAAQEEEKPKRKRRTRAEIEDAGEAAESEAAEVEDEEEKPAAKSSKVTLDDIRKAVAEKKEKHMQVMKDKLKEDFGVSKTPDLSEDQYEAFYNFVNALK